MKRSVEKIACACWVLKGSASNVYLPSGAVVVPIPTNILMMDHYNLCIKHQPNFGEHMEPEASYITTHGRVVDGKEAFTIALNANQLTNERPINGRLDPLDLWPRT